MGVLSFKRWGQVEVGVQEALGLLALRFHRFAEMGEALWRAAKIVQSFDPLSLYLASDFLHEISHQGIQHLLEGFVGEQAGLRGRELLARIGIEAGEQRDIADDLSQFKNSGSETVFKVGGEIGNLIGEVNDLSLKRRLLIEEVFAELGMVCGGIVA